MTKSIFFLLSLVLLTSCGSQNAIDSFYNAHKNDDQVQAIRVPRFMLTLLSSISPEVQSLIGNTKDLRYMQFPSTTMERTKALNNEMATMTGNSFIEVYRNNDNAKRNVVSIREKGNTVKEILIYNNDASKGSFLYFKGNFDPVRVREMVKNKDFEKLDDVIINQFNIQ
ncbi:DUF4252 domain-containing protein [Dokdonia sinensis]|uniref:DUF4252 domain-containing protein n=1 Tax=Dokdonia sinensis TaxID=2479847 RepID=A0A3M0GEK4_9FLAO|nr:DUF4252 domain-containing protein [Dokdonia sinensis]RMB62728.1 DUF4252 domain-containing protein [Dokdonia sinensis]